jgi:hypothetical protein
MFEEILKELQQENPEALLADGFKTALVGVVRRVGQPTLACYDAELCIQILAEDMSHEEAQEHFDFNVAGAWVGIHTPVFLYKPESEWGM